MKIGDDAKAVIGIILIAMLFIGSLIGFLVTISTREDATITSWNYNSNEMIFVTDKEPNKQYMYYVSLINCPRMVGNLLKDGRRIRIHIKGTEHKFGDIYYLGSIDGYSIEFLEPVKAEQEK